MKLITQNLVQLKYLALIKGVCFWLVFSTNLLAAATPISTDPASVTRLAVLTALASGTNSFGVVVPNQAPSLSAITTALATAITPNSASLPNPPINSFTPALLNGCTPAAQTCGCVAGNQACALGYIPLALMLYKLNNYPQSTAAQYSNLITNLFYAGANANLANLQLDATLAALTPPVTLATWVAQLAPDAATPTDPAIVANFFSPDVGL